MKRTRDLKTILFLLLWFAISLGFGFGFYYARKSFFQNSKYEINSNYHIDSYNVSLSIMDTNKVDVTETIVIDTEGKDAIKNDFKKKFPIWQVNYDPEGKLDHKRVSIKSLRSDDEKFVLKQAPNSKQIQLTGEAPGAAGSHTHTIKYRYHMGQDTIVGKDVLSFRLFDKVDRQKINHINFSISFPENIEAEIYLLDGKTDIGSLMEQNVKERTINISLEDYEIKDFLSLYVDLPDKFFTSFTYNYGFIGIGVCAVVVFISLVGLSMWYVQFTKKNHKLNRIPHYPTDGLDAATLGYVGGENDLNKLSYALLAELILKGYIDAKKENGELIVRKGMARFDAKVMSANERALYNTLFQSEKEVVISKFDFKQVNNSIGQNIYERVDKKFNKFENVKPVIFLTVVNVILLTIWLLTFIFANDMEPIYEFLYPLAMEIVFITNSIAIIVNNRFTYGNRLCTKINHLKFFYEEAEQTDFDLLLFDDKDYYFKIIPYIYILGCKNSIINEFVENRCGDIFEVEDGRLTQNYIK